MGEKTVEFYVGNSLQGTPTNVRLFDTMPSAEPIVFVGDTVSSIRAAERSRSEGWEGDRAFGTHIKEAVGIVKDWAKNR